jgi:hypothetical protein
MDGEVGAGPRRLGRKTVSVAAVVLVAGVLAGCGSSSAVKARSAAKAVLNKAMREMDAICPGATE